MFDKQIAIKTDGSYDQVYLATLAMLDYGYHHGGSGWSRQVVESNGKRPDGFCWNFPYSTSDGGIEYSSNTKRHTFDSVLSIPFNEFVYPPSPSLSELF